MALYPIVQPVVKPMNPLGRVYNNHHGDICYVFDDVFPKLSFKKKDVYKLFIHKRPGK